MRPQSHLRQSNLLKLLRNQSKVKCQRQSHHSERLEKPLHLFIFDLRQCCKIDAAVKVQALQNFRRTVSNEAEQQRQLFLYLTLRKIGRLDQRSHQKTYRTWEGFGQLALLYSAPRSASIKAVKSSFLWYIDRETFRNAVSSMIIKNYKENRIFIDKNLFFKYLTVSQKDKLVSIALCQKFTKNKQICKQGELAAFLNPESWQDIREMISKAPYLKVNHLNNIQVFQKDASDVKLFALSRMHK